MEAMTTLKDVLGPSAGATANPKRRLKDQTMRTADVIVDVLAKAGVTAVFGIPGGTICPIYDALIDHPEIKCVTTKHESAAVFAAIGYARITGRIGVVAVTSGPGVLNTLTGLATAYCDGVPILILAGEVSRETYGKGALQEGSAYSLNIVEMASHISKAALEIVEPQSAPALLRRAIATAMTGKKGPVVMTVPLNVSKATITVPSVSQSSSTHFEIDSVSMDHAAKALSRSARMVIFAGSGCRHDRGPELLKELAEVLQCPVMTTPKAKGVFPENHPLSLGVFGMGGHPSTTAYLEHGIETILAIGTSLGDLATNGWSKLLQPTRSFIHVDVDAAQIGRAYTAHVGIACSVETFVEEILLRLPPAFGRKRFGVRCHADAEAAQAETPSTIAPQRALWELQHVFPSDTIYTIDSGEHYFFALHYLRATRPDTVITMTGLGSMGSSVGAAIGAQLARPDRRIAVICGDGGFAMTCGEISTAAAEKLPIVFVVFNDGRLGMVELGHLAIFGRTPAFAVGPVDVAAAGRALGADSYTVDRPGQLLEIEALQERGHRPVVVDVHIDPKIKMPKNGRFEALGAPKR
jgi:acetolactate synthase I/II/III large subunit